MNNNNFHAEKNMMNIKIMALPYTSLEQPKKNMVIKVLGWLNVVEAEHTPKLFGIDFHPDFHLFVEEQRGYNPINMNMNLKSTYLFYSTISTKIILSAE
jgi:hypothetical protein